MNRYIKYTFLCFICLVALSGCTQSHITEQQEILDYLNSLDAQGYIKMDSITEEQLQRLLDAGLDGVDAELQLIADGIMAGIPTEPVLAPTDAYLRQWRQERDGHSYQFDLSLFSQEDYDELCQAYLDGGEAAIEECIQEKLADGWDVLVRDFDNGK